METKIDEIAPDIFRLSTWIGEVAPPAGFTFNQFLIRDEEPFLFHTGMRGLFPLVSAAVGKLVAPASLRWVGFGHVEADECGALNHWLAAAPNAQAAHGELACMLSVNDLADRPPRAFAAGEVLVTGSHRLRFLPTPHVPHNWEAGLWYDETTGTLLAGDLFTHIGAGPALVEDSVVDPAVAAEKIFRGTSGGPTLVPTLRGLADLEPTTLALMHGSSFHGDGGAELRALAAAYEQALALG
ncbi:MBL fold metallo-hydrolase [Frankia sp. CNm7]|uniref:MBL fold metallo-hydrolase n=1 Tax=Frankia nepalensis TaxID=1836974 RepID=A0A937UN52_9ACTN|nr:MBL fold metallo-hydrolase [Frankia nepalensis]MBL7496484.1 MBL fold metallo-hydrolase [Frankia nepalensis]MBL7511386.1 MBL fold metallo-hydrolase [Frankia nepalensis]MBL7521230.1 MBL fold metallo-hydrolase [Frankia nepalensis]MBL7625890.1 MBL fold metallo-hydrolase [Frankia nepalensis]